MPRRIRTLGGAACLAGIAVVIAPVAPLASSADELDPGAPEAIVQVEVVEESSEAVEVVDGSPETVEVADDSPEASEVAEEPSATDEVADESTEPLEIAEETSVVQALAVFVVDTADDTVDVDPGDGVCADADGDCSLRAAVQEANALDGADTVELGAGVHVLDLVGSAEDLAATGDLDVVGALTVVGSTGATIDASALGDRIFDVRPGASLTISGVELTGGSAADAPTASGGAVLNAGVLDATDVVITDNFANRAGGGIESSAGSTTTLLRVTLSDNTTGPTTPGNGGGFHLTGAGTVTITDSVVTGNTAANEGGGLWNSFAGTMTVTRTEISGNVAAGALATNGGGGIFNQPDAEGTTGGTLTVVDSTITGNAATGAAGSGGGIFNSRGAVTISGSLIAENTAPRAGGGIEALAGTTTITDTDFFDNTTGAAPGNGGALHLTGPVGSTSSADRPRATSRPTRAAPSGTRPTAP